MSDITDDRFSSESFVPKQYTDEIFNENSEEKSRLIYKELVSRKSKAAEELKANVYRNYEKFINSSREITTLELDVFEMKRLLSEMGSKVSLTPELSFDYDYLYDLFNLDADFPQLPFESQENKKNKEELQSTVRWLLNLNSELDSLIAQRKFDLASAMIQKANSSITHQFPFLKTVLTNLNHVVLKDLEEKTQKLTNELLRDLSNMNLSQPQIIWTIHYLSLLSQKKRAKENFFLTRSKLIEREIKKLNYDGDEVMYITDLSRLMFSQIKNTCLIYFQAFPDTTMSSGFVEWCLTELDHFIFLFKERVKFSDDFKVLGSCLSIAQTYCRMLREHGLDLEEFLTRKIYSLLETTVAHAYSRLESAVSKQVQDDNWAGSFHLITFEGTTFKAKNIEQRQLEEKLGFGLSTPPRGEDIGYYLTYSALFFATEVIRFANDVTAILNSDFLLVMLGHLDSLFSSYLQSLSNEIMCGKNTDSKYLYIIANSLFLVKTLFPRLVSIFEQTCHSDSTVVYSSYLTKLERRAATIRQQYCICRGKELSYNQLNALDWNNSTTLYCNPSISTFAPSTKFQKLFEYISTFSLHIAKICGSIYTIPIISRLLLEIVNNLNEGPFWKKIDSKICTISNDGLHQLALDMKYFIYSAGDYILEETCSVVIKIIEKATNFYFASCGDDIDRDTALKDNEWFEEIINKFL